MLVLSRRLTEKIVLPTLDTTIQVVSVKPGVVRLGIEAPPSVTILREELQDRAAEWAEPGPQPGDPVIKTQSPQCRSVVCRGLDAVASDLELLRRQLQSGRTLAAQATLAGMGQAFQMLRQQVQGEQGVNA